MDAKKYDTDKTQWMLLPWQEVEEIVKVLQFGADKYGKDNWKGGMIWSRYCAAALRHILAWWMGEQRDDESGYHHLAHACACLIFLMYYDNNDVQEDDRE